MVYGFVGISLSLALAMPPGRVVFGEEVFGSAQGTVELKVFVPAEEKMLRGIILHVANYKLNPQDRWAEICRAMNLAHLVVSMNMKENNRPAKMRKALDDGLPQLAAASGHPELVDLPIMGTGHSAGGMVIQVLSPAAARMLTNCVSCSWIADSEKIPPEAAATPMLFTLGAIPDDFKMLPDIESHFLPARKKGLPWGLAVQWGCAHDFGNSACLFVPWMEAIFAARVPTDWNPLAGPVKLRDVKQEDGWLGDQASTQGNFAAIESWADYNGDKAAASWFPNRAVASVWRALMSKDAPATLEAATLDGKAKLPPFSPKAERGMLLEPGADMLLSVALNNGFPATKVEFFEKDALLGEAVHAPWQWTWKSIPQGPHVICAQWTTAEGKQGVTNPALFVVRKHAVAQPQTDEARPEDNKK
ncbi:MAG: hypothetical protein NTW87_09995 [Planctomycetota bacterium]|nr:hypothetical protein [Planctomycetota bacterium]